MKGLALFAVLAFVKLTGALAHDIEWSGVVVIALLWQDASIALAFEALSRALRPRVAWTVYGALCAYAVANLPVVRVLATPMTLPMLRATDGALSDSVVRYATLGNVALVFVGGALAWIAPRRLPRTASTLPVCALVLVAVGGFAAGADARTHGLHRSAVPTLVRSAFPRLAAAGSSDVEWRAPFEPGAPSQDCTALYGTARGCNVLMVVLESVAAADVKPWGGSADPMPNLTALANRSLVFENAYAVYPESVKGLVALLASRPPAMDTAAEDYAGVAFETLPRTLGGAGYASALFHSGRFDYLGMNAVVRERGYDVLHDAGDIGGVHESSFGVDERSTVEHALRWIRARGDTSWFVTYMPIAGHHPYDAPEAGPYDARTERGAYYNALHYADRYVGRLIAGVPDDTLIVVVGDHGQAFHQHPGNYGHSFFLYEENVRVPLLIAAPGVEARRIERVASHLDVAPTVLELLGRPVPASFRGGSLLEPAPRPALMFTDYSMALLALRDGRWKFIHEVESGRSALFDLAADPGERVDLAGRHGTRVRAYRDRLLRWGAAQRAAYR